MERSKNITNITSILLLSLGLLASTTLLAVALFASPAEAKPASVLLQEGLYAEQIEGDLEAAIKIYEQVVTEAKTAQQTAAQATYRIGMCYLKKGQEEKAAEYFQEVVSNYRTQKILVKKADEQLKKIKPETKKSVFEEIDYQVIRFLGEQFGKTALEAGQQHLLVNSQIYYVDLNGFCYQGGMNAFYNWTGRTITQKVSFGGTSYQNQTHYGVDGHELNTEIVPDKTRPNHWQIYWIPDEPLAPEEHLYYGWSMNDERKLPKLPGDMYSLIMQNKFGSPVIETFFLVLPKDLRISQSNPSTGSQELLDFNVYWWTKQIQQGENHVEHVQLKKLPASSTKAIMTQEIHNTIDANELIHFKSPNRISNNNSEPITTTSFINSDFVMLTKMYEENGTAIPFETTHEGNIYRYKITFNKPIMPGESMVYYTEGTISGLIKPVPGSKEVFRYFMVHSPSAGQPVLRIETYLLPEDAVFISTSTPDIQKSEKDGRIELRVEKVVPADGSITTEFQYRLSSAEPLKLEPAPWVDGEMLRFNLNTMTGMKIGDIIYAAETAEVEGQSIWRVESYMNVTANKMQQYARVDAVLDDFTPLFGRTKNQMGDFEAEYGPDKVELTVTAAGKQTTREIRLDSAVYDNEQVLYLIRRMPLQEEYSTQFSIFPVQSGTVTECKITVTGKEKVTVSAGMFDCHAVELAVYVGPIKTLEHHLWISADQHQYLVKYDSGQAIMELAEIGLKTATAKNIEFSEYGISLQLPAGWYHMENPTMGVYRFSVQLISPQMESWLVLTGGERASAFDSARTAANMDIELLKGFFKNYTVREDSWTDLTVDSMPAVSFQADYEDKATQMVECRTYILGKSMIYWFVLRVEEDKFEANRDEFNAIVNSFKLNR